MSHNHATHSDGNQEEARKKDQESEKWRQPNTTAHRTIETYAIKIITSSEYDFAGTTNDIFIALVGEDGTSIESLRSNGALNWNYKSGATTDFDLEGPDIGVPLYIKLKLEPLLGTFKDAWACDEVIITYHGEDVSYPVYDWINNEVSVTSGKALTYTQERGALRSLCASEVDKARVKFEWVEIPTKSDIGWGLPRYVNTTTLAGLPGILKKTIAQADTFIEKGIVAFVNTANEKTKSIFVGEPKSLDDFKKLYSGLNDGKDPDFIDRWDQDVEFGRQQLMGVTPLALKRCTELPICCKITNSDVSRFLNGSSLQNEIKRGKIFIGDYSEVFQGVERNKGPSGETLYCPDVIGLFHVDENHDLVPIAIQLIPNDPGSVFTPNDNNYDWLLAKMYYRTACANMHEWYYHFLLTHNLMEPFSVALFRNFPRSHPIYKLLRPHLQTVSAINEGARATLIGPGTTANKVLAISARELVRSEYKTVDMADLDFPKVLEERGLDDSKVLPKNYFRDDALQLWKIIREFSSSILKIYYKSDQDVEADREIQGFAHDVATLGLGWQDGDTKGMPEHISKLDDLIHLCTVLMYTSSVSHASVNFPQYQIYQFIPNCPVSMRMPPHKKGEGSLERILKSLPNKEIASSQIAITYVLSEKSPNEVYLGEYPMNLFTDLDALKAIKTYRESLYEYFDEVDKRNAKAGDDADLSRHEITVANTANQSYQTTIKMKETMALYDRPMLNLAWSKLEQGSEQYRYVIYQE